MLDSRESLPVESRDAWFTMLRGYRLLEAVLQEQLYSHGLTVGSFEILWALSRCESSEGMRMSELAGMVGQSRSRLTHSAVRLESQGWAERRQSAADRRGVMISITDSGRQQYELAEPIYDRALLGYFKEHISDGAVFPMREVVRSLFLEFFPEGDGPDFHSMNIFNSSESL